jgi:radical SAM protein (TIGR01212 family)
VLRLLAGLKARGPAGDPLDVWLELGLQSASDETLARLNRGHDVACFDDAVLRARRFGIPTAAHVILGLPGEGKEHMLATALHLGGLPVEGVKLHHLYVEEGTALASDYARGTFRTLARDEYMELAIAFLRRLRPDMVIMRLSGRGNEERLIAPRWGTAPGSFAQDLADEMKRRGVRQGDLFPGGHSTVSGR